MHSELRPVYRLINFFQIGHQRFDIFIAYITSRRRHLMNNTALNLSLRKCCIDSLAKSCQTVHTEHVNTLNTAIFEIVHYTDNPNFALSFSPIQTPKISLRPSICIPKTTLTKLFLKLRFHYRLKHIAEQLFHAVLNVICARKMLTVYKFFQQFF